MSITSSTWDPAQYQKFANERVRPAFDLLGRVPLETASHIVDLGCGTGNMTAVLKQAFSGADVLGVDGAETMLAAARATAPDCRFEVGDFSTWTAAAAPDLIFSNAALHWVTDHTTLFPRLLSMLTPGGVLAVQMPSMHDAPFRALQNEVAQNGPWSRYLEDAGYARALLPVESYYDILRPQVRSLDIWLTTYLHVLTGEDPVTEWAAGSSLRPFLDKLPPDQAAAYRAAYSEALRPHYPKQSDGSTLLPFKRLFLVGRI